MNPTRQDIPYMSGATETFEFQLFNTLGAPFSITNDTVEFLVSKGQGKTWALRKTSAPGAHFDAANSIVRFTLSAADITPSTATRVWWFEIWRITSTGEKKPHIVGELTVIGTNRV